jgi:hypothetical protein
MNRLHFGCFNCPREGWLNTDVTPHLFVARVPGLAWLMHKMGKMTDERLEEHRQGIYRKIHYLNVTKSWSYSSGMFEAIYSSHVLEHLPLHGAKTCLAESYRCLRQGGVLRISVPDLDTQIRDYDPNRSMDWSINLFEANERSEKNMHHFMYNFESLRTLLQSVGFSQVTRCDYQKGDCPDVENLDNRPGSLFVEAVK